MPVQASVVVDEWLMSGSEGYNAATGEYGDMIAFSILISKVTRTALQAAASVAGLMISPNVWSQR